MIEGYLLLVFVIGLIGILTGRIDWSDVKMALGFNAGIVVLAVVLGPLR